MREVSLTQAWEGTSQATAWSTASSPAVATASLRPERKGRGQGRGNSEKARRLVLSSGRALLCAKRLVAGK